MEHGFLGPEFNETEIEEFLKWSKLDYRRMDDTADETAAMLEAGQVIGWFQGRMEFGPRALGGRSILASPIPVDMQARLNEIKDREDFRPVAPVVMEEFADEWFVDARVSPFMLFVYDVVAEKASSIPAVKHVDGTARIQTITARRMHLTTIYSRLSTSARACPSWSIHLSIRVANRSCARHVTRSRAT